MREHSIPDRVNLSGFKLVHSCRRYTGNPEGSSPADGSHLEYELCTSFGNITLKVVIKSFNLLKYLVDESILRELGENQYKGELVIRGTYVIHVVSQGMSSTLDYR